MKKDLNEIFKKITDTLFKKKKKKPFYHDPEHDWQRILFSFVSLFILIGILTGFFFYKLNRGDLFKVEAEDSAPVEVFDKNILKQNNDYYDAREKKFNELKPTNSRVASQATTTATTTPPIATSTSSIDLE